MNEELKMLKFILIFVLLLTLTAWEIPNLKRKKDKKEWIIFVVLMLIAIALSILYLNDLTL